jgi:hypothetical protein
VIELTVDVSKDDFPKLTPGQISKLTRSVASRVRQAIIAATPVGDRPPDPRRAKSSWTAVKKDEGGYSFSNPLIQTKFLEKGSPIGERPWPSAKRRTVYSGDRVYSSQAPQGITKKAGFEAVADKVASELFKLLIEGKSIAKG